MVKLRALTCCNKGLENSLTNWVIVNSDNNVIIKMDVPFLVQDRLASICIILVSILALKESFLIDYHFYCIFELISLLLIIFYIEGIVNNDTS